MDTNILSTVDKCFLHTKAVLICRFKATPYNKALVPYYVQIKCFETVHYSQTSFSFNMTVCFSVQKQLVGRKNARYDAFFVPAHLKLNLSRRDCFTLFMNCPSSLLYILYELQYVVDRRCRAMMPHGLFAWPFLISGSSLVKKKFLFQSASSSSAGAGKYRTS